VHSNGKVDVAYDDGDSEVGVKPKYVRLLEAQLEARPDTRTDAQQPAEAAQAVRPEAAVEDDYGQDDFEEEVKPQREEARRPSNSSSHSHAKHASEAAQGGGFEAAVETMSALRSAARERGMDGQALFDQLSGKRRGDDDDRRDFLTLTDFRSGAKRIFGSQVASPFPCFALSVDLSL